jgi:hypothetical protein
MDIEKNGELESTSPEEVFAAVYRARAYGMVHFKNPGGAAVFVTFERGLAQHASGGGLDGEAAVEAVLSWREGDYRFIDDIRPGDDDFPPNVPKEVAEGLGAGAAEEPSAEAAGGIPPLPVLPAGEPAEGMASAETAEELLVGLAEVRFTGCCAVGPARSRRGVFIFAGGEARGGLFWDGEGMRRGSDARAVLERDFGRHRENLEFYKLDEETAGVLALGLAGGIAIARIPATALNIEEYVAWVQRETGTVLISIVAGLGSANILIKSGEMLGAVIAPSTVINPEPDEALALYYSPGATLEVFAEVRRTP